MLFHAVAEGVAADAEEPGGTGLIAVHLGHGLGEQAPFVFLERAEFGGRRLVSNRELVLFPANEFGEIADVDQRPHDHDARVADDVFEFPDVAGPVVLAEQQLRPRGEAGNRLAELAGKAGHEMAGEQRQVSIAFQQAGGLELDHRKAIEQIFAKLLGGDHRAEITMGGGDDADVDLAGLQRTEALNFLILQGAQQLTLRRQRHVADFVEKESAVVGVLKQADFVLYRSGEGTFDVAEELAFKQRFDEGGAVQGNEWTLGTRSEMVEGFGDQLLSGAGLARDENGSVVRRDALDLGVEMPHCRTIADHVGEDRILGNVLFQFQSRQTGAMSAEQGGEASPQGVGGDRLIEVVRGSFANGLDGGLGGVERGHQDDVDGRVELDDAFEQFHAGEPGHDDIGEHDLRLAVEDEFEAELRIGEAVQLQIVAAQSGCQQLQAGRTIVDYRHGDWSDPSHSVCHCTPGVPVE